MTAPTNIVTGLARIGTFIRAEQWRHSDVSGLTPTQAQILIHLAQRGPARVTAVADEIAVTQPTASDSVTALVRKGLIEKRPDPDDARAVSLHPTPNGRRAADALTLWPDALLAAVETLAPDEQAAFLKGLTKMIRRLQSDGAIPVQRMCATCRYFRPNVHADPTKPHHCAFVDAAFGDAALRLDCGDHVEADTEEGDRNWRRFTSHASAE
ncbi:MAG: MarR family winged helix-turn-helix transcriptional regulator [Minwuiales bacterium]|nr:MarR family winged helix-turn-helix transcriptional regulator [Minwuiales bacterium]